MKIKHCFTIHQAQVLKIVGISGRFFLLSGLSMQICPSHSKSRESVVRHTAYLIHYKGKSTFSPSMPCFISNIYPLSVIPLLRDYLLVDSSYSSYIFVFLSPCRLLLPDQSPACHCKGNIDTLAFSRFPAMGDTRGITGTCIASFDLGINPLQWLLFCVVGKAPDLRGFTINIPLCTSLNRASSSLSRLQIRSSGNCKAQFCFTREFQHGRD